MSMHKTRPTESNTEMNLETSVVCRNRGRNSTLQTSKHVRFPLLPHTLSALQAAGRWWGAVDVYSWVARLYGVFNLFLFSFSLTVHWRGKMQRWRNCLSLWCLKSTFNICLFFLSFLFYYSHRYPTYQGCHSYGDAMEKYSSGGSEKHLTQYRIKDQHGCLEYREEDKLIIRSAAKITLSTPFQR